MGKNKTGREPERAGGIVRNGGAVVGPGGHSGAGTLEQRPERRGVVSRGKAGACDGDERGGLKKLNKGMIATSSAEGEREIRQKGGRA